MMHEPLAPAAIPVDPPPASPRRGWTRLSWLVILGAVGALAALRTLAGHDGGTAAPSGPRLDLAVLRLQLQLLVAARYLSPDADPRQTLEEARQLGDGDPDRALRLSAFATEMVGPGEALKQMDAAERQANRPLTTEERRLRAILRQLYQDQARGAIFHPSVSPEEAELLQARLGWFGALALYPTASETALQAASTAAGSRGAALLEAYRAGRHEVMGQARNTLLVLGGFAAGACLLLLLGLLLLPLFLALWRAGFLRVGLSTGIAHGGVYAETFALWLVLYAGMLVLGDLFLHDAVPLVVRGSVAMPLSLLVVLWPVVRGVPWRQVRQDIGWTAGRNPLLEPAAGLTCYVVNLPVVAVGFGLMLVLVSASSAVGGGSAGGGPAMPSHPAIPELADADGPALLLTFALLAVVAPFVEETMFRGVLHRSLRESAFPAQPLLGGLVTALVVSVLFAAVHPQGPLFIPVLAAMALGFSLAREWRGTLIAGMVAHGTSNFLVGLLAYFLLRAG